MTREFRELNDRRPGLPPPQFSLLFLLVLITAVAGMIVLGRRSGPLAVLSGLIFLSVLAHVSSTAIGGRLRGSKIKSPLPPAPDDGGVRIRQPIKAYPADFARVTQLSHKKALHRKPIAWAIGLGSTCSAVLGAAVLCVVAWDQVSIANILFGASSAAVIGGMIAFWLSSLFQVARDALSDAHKES